MKDEPEIFVSRHGRRTAIDNAELKDLKIDEQPEVFKATAEAPAAPKFKPMRDFHMPRPEISKKKIAVVSLSLLAVILLPLAVLELVGYQYNASASGLKNEVKRIAKETALPAQKKAVTASSMDKTLAELNSSTNGACRGGLFDNIASLYPRSKDALKACNETRTKANAIINNLSTLQNIERYNEKVDTILKPAIAASDSPYAVLPDQVAAWQTASDNLSKVDAPIKLKTFQASLLQLTKDIGAQWTALNNANNSQDKAAFDESVAKLSSFYDSMRDLSPTLESIQQDVQSDLTASANAL